MLLLAGGCDSTEIDPLGFVPFEAEFGTFSVYGYLVAGTPEQAVRVVPLRTGIERPETPAEALLEARVFSRRVGAPDSVEWVQEAVAFEDSTYGAVFRTDRVVPVPGETYTLTLLRGDGTVTRATTEVPVAPTFRQEAPEEEGGRVEIPLVFESAYPPVQVEVVYRVPAYQFNGNPFTLEYPPPGEGVAPYRFDLDLTAAVPALRALEPRWLSAEEEPLLPLTDAAVRVFVAGVSDRPRPGDVRTASIEGGSGWWVGLTSATYPLMLDRALLNAAGFCSFPDDPACRACEAVGEPRPRCQ